jgi:hypothetical protein
MICATRRDHLAREPKSGLVATCHPGRCSRPPEGFECALNTPRDPASLACDTRSSCTTRARAQISRLSGELGPLEPHTQDSFPGQLLAFIRERDPGPKTSTGVPYDERRHRGNLWPRGTWRAPAFLSYVGRSLYVSRKASAMSL